MFFQWTVVLVIYLSFLISPWWKIDWYFIHILSLRSRIPWREFTEFLLYLCIYQITLYAFLLQRGYPWLSWNLLCWTRWLSNQRCAYPCPLGPWHLKVCTNTCYSLYAFQLTGYNILTLYEKDICENQACLFLKFVVFIIDWRKWNFTNHKKIIIH